MENTIKNLVRLISTEITNDIMFEGMEKGDTLEMVFRAYNDLQGDERNYVDYLYDIENSGDIIECLRGGMTAKDIHHLYNESQFNTTRYFFFHPENHPTPQPITWEQLRDLMIDELESVLYAVIAYPWIDSYREIYTKYVCDYMINHCLV